MPSVAAVRLTYNPKVLWFDPAGVEFSAGDALIVKTERGQEYGVADEGLKEVPDEAISKLKSALKPVLRRATEEDTAKWNDLCAQAEEALPVFREMVEESKLDMRPVTVEFLFDGDKAIFYFEADQRVDFRDLVRQLASRFHMRIDMRQIGVRDEARMVGGYGHCGQELCCARFGGNFNPVSIRMAKDQDLSLNPQKISGLCGRLMCCLRYEADTYKEFKCHCPKHGAMINTPDGQAKVVEINVPRETVTLQVEDKRLRVPVADMEMDEKTGRPNAVSAEVLEEARNAANGTNRLGGVVDSSIFTGKDKLAAGPVVKRNEDPRRSSRKKEAAAADEGKKSSSRRRRRGGKGSGDGQQDKQNKQRKQQSQGSQGDSRKRRRSHSVKSEEYQSSPRVQAKQAAANKPKQSSRRPGQRSSGLAQGADFTPKQGNGGSAQPTTSDHRRSRRRSHKAQGGEGGSAE